ncbi:hypothetical protein K488DRAFT_85719 [Vararia minispora EC-137]|uniref:Uncharacterized protein n=1 Tax=Vararia minispora EC-137 TaxID=1314806 RepID=A0ACB8QL80_9AGAM|nr:hypothetical protein K488DRAFT_85719 [Vararia minispora EC-137]
MSAFLVVSSDITQTPTAFLGGYYLAICLEMLETSFIVSQLILFYGSADAYPALVHSCVAFVSFFSFVQTTCEFLTAWKMLVDGEFVVLRRGWGWYPALVPVFTIILSAPVQALYTWRCYLILKRKPLIPLLLSMGIIAAVVVHIYAGVTYYSRIGTYNPAPVPAIVCSLAIQIGLDIALSSILFTFLLRSFRSTYNDQARRFVTRLMIVAWESALPPTMDAIAALVVYITSTYGAGSEPSDSAKVGWATPTQNILGKLGLTNGAA